MNNLYVVEKATMVLYYAALGGGNSEVIIILFQPFCGSHSKMLFVLFFFLKNIFVSSCFEKIV